MKTFFFATLAAVTVALGLTSGQASAFWETRQVYRIDPRCGHRVLVTERYWVPDCDHDHHDHGTLPGNPGVVPYNPRNVPGNLGGVPYNYGNVPYNNGATSNYPYGYDRYLNRYNDRYLDRYPVQNSGGTFGTINLQFRR